jgi:hypothetical protein
MRQVVSTRRDRLADLMPSVADRIRGFLESLGAIVSQKPALVPVPRAPREPRRPRR